MLMNKLNKEGLSIKIAQKVGGPFGNDKYKDIILKVYINDDYKVHNIFSNYFYIDGKWELNNNTLTIKDDKLYELDNYNGFGFTDLYYIKRFRHINNVKYGININGTNIKINKINLIRKTAEIEFNLLYEDKFVLKSDIIIQDPYKLFGTIQTSPTSGIKDYYVTIILAPGSILIPSYLDVNLNWKITNFIDEIMISN